MSLSVKQYISLIYERRDIVIELINSFEKYGGWAILYPPRSIEKKEQIEDIFNKLTRFIEIDKELFDLETSNKEPSLPLPPSDDHYVEIDPPDDLDEDTEIVGNKPTHEVEIELPEDDEPIEEPSIDEPSDTDHSVDIDDEDFSIEIEDEEE